MKDYTVKGIKKIWEDGLILESYPAQVNVEIYEIREYPDGAIKSVHIGKEYMYLDDYKKNQCKNTSSISKKYLEKELNGIDDEIARITLEFNKQLNKLINQKNKIADKIDKLNSGNPIV